MRTELNVRQEAETRIAMNKDRQKLLGSFVPIDPRISHHMSRKLRHPATGVWLTESQEMNQWLATENAGLWIYGIPGAGKTVLASIVIEEALNAGETTTAVAFFYCDYKDTATELAHFTVKEYLIQIDVVRCQG